MQVLHSLPSFQIFGQRCWISDSALLFNGFTYLLYIRHFISPMCRLQEESASNQESKKLEVQAQIEAERRATEQYRVRPRLILEIAAIQSSSIECQPRLI